jgi:general secretion pathway protein G
MKELILRTEAGGPGLADQEDFKAVMSSAPAGAGTLEYFDLQSVLSLLYDTAVPLLQTAVKPNMLKDLPVRLDWTLLPPARTMRPYFRSLGAFIECDGQSLTLSVHSPIGYVLPVAVVGGAAAMLWVRQMSHGGDDAPFGAADPESALIVAELQAQALVEAVRSHQVATGRLPESLQALLQATNPESGQPYLERVGLDPWGNAYQYRVLDAGKGEFEVRSFGPDGVPQTPDDVVLPRRED